MRSRDSSEGDADFTSGDGLLSITRAFNISISGLSDTDPNTYAQVFLVILVIFLLWVFLFSHFDKRDQTGHGRAVLWQVMHFPLSFSILIMLGAMVVSLHAKGSPIPLVTRRSDMYGTTCNMTYKWDEEKLT